MVDCIIIVGCFLVAIQRLGETLILMFLLVRNGLLNCLEIHLKLRIIILRPRTLVSILSLNLLATFCAIGHHNILLLSLVHRLLNSCLIFQSFVGGAHSSRLLLKLWLLSGNYSGDTGINRVVTVSELVLVLHHHFLLVLRPP